MSGVSTVAKSHVCTVCGKTFESTARRVLSCSPECAAERNRRMCAEYYRKKRSRPFAERACVVCGKPFAPNSPTHSVCSDECRKIHENERETARRIRHRKPREPRACAVCGTMFTPRKGDGVYCSKRCSKKAWLAQRRKAYAKSCKARKPKPSSQFTVTPKLAPKRDASGLTLAQKYRVAHAQSLPAAECWAIAKHWTPAERKYAMRRYAEANGLRI